MKLIGVTQGFQQIRKLVILRGRYFDDADFSTVSKVCVVSEHLAQIALPTDNPVGQEIHVGELSFTVIGTFRERVGTFGQSEIRDDSVLVPFPLIKYYAGDNYIVTLYVQAAAPKTFRQVTQEVDAKSCRSRHRAGGELQRAEPHFDSPDRPKYLAGADHRAAADRMLALSSAASAS